VCIACISSACLLVLVLVLCKTSLWPPLCIIMLHMVREGGAASACWWRGRCSGSGSFI
jgi:hypothetical protein